MAIPYIKAIPTVTMDTGTATPIPTNGAESKEYITLVNCTA